MREEVKEKKPMNESIGKNMVVSVEFMNNVIRLLENLKDEEVPFESRQIMIDLWNMINEKADKVIRREEYLIKAKFTTKQYIECRKFEE
jgi:endonuclease V-like protein UPF0215 family